MSQDLFAAFGDPGSNTQQKRSSQTTAPSFSFFDDFSSPPQQPVNQPWDPIVGVPQSQTATSAGLDQADDDFGDFEDSTQPIESKADVWNAFSKPSTNAFTNLDIAQNSSSSRVPKTTVKKELLKGTNSSLQRSYALRDANVLFDAEDEQPDDDEFGEFEDAEEENSAQAVQNTVLDIFGLDDIYVQTKPATSTEQAHKETASIWDLESLNLTDGPQQETKLAKVVQTMEEGHSRQRSIQDSEPGGSKANPLRIHEISPWDSELSPPMTPPGLTSSNIQEPKKSLVSNAEPWDDFNAWEQNPPLSSVPAVMNTFLPPSTTSKTEEPWDNDAWQEESSQPLPATSTTKSSSPPPNPFQPSETSPNELPPTNIPPPAVLLSLFPQIFSTAETRFFKPTTSQRHDMRPKIFSNPATTKFLQGFIAIATVCARVIAGRKQRWKRDVHLSQSMRIGPASGGKLSGMKVTSVDKSESAKEDREVADVIRSWQAQVGRLKSAITEAKKAGGADFGAVPELREVMPVRTAKELEGGVLGPKPCALCGLKRDERVAKVDVDVQDSFGEWWIEGMNMHRACRNFWGEHKDILRQR